tara:strand:+ start:1835 stop:3415 length:1581 start_codon:yes stop_codon:yes gene_type:complete
MALSKLIVGQISSAAKSAFKMDIAVDAMKTTLIEKSADELDSKLPIELPIDVKGVLSGKSQLPNDFLNPEYISKVQSIPETQKQEIRDIIAIVEDNLKTTIGVKNSMSGALNTLVKPIETLETLSETLGTTIPKLNSVITALKILPLPSSIPPGVGLPMSVINGFSLTLDALKTIIDKTEGPISSISPSIAQIQKVITPIIGKLLAFDSLFINITNIIIFVKLLLASTPNEELTDSEINQIVTNTTDEILADLALTPGPITSNSDGGVNELSEAILLERLQPGSNNPLIYGGYLLILEYDPNNQYSFPSRRIKGTFLNIQSNGDNISKPEPDITDESERLFLRLKDSVLYNLKSNVPVEEGTDTTIPYPAPYSFSSSVQVLVSEIEYEIDRFIAGKESLVNNENFHIVFDIEGVPVGFNPLVEGITLGVKGNGEFSGRDQDAINYVEGLNVDGRNPSTIFDNYQVQTERRSWVYDKNDVKVGRIIGEYGTRLTFAGYLAVNYVVNRGGNVIQSYRDDNPNVPDRND